MPPSTPLIRSLLIVMLFSLASAPALAQGSGDSAPDEQKKRDAITLESEKLRYEVRYRDARVATVHQHLGCSAKSSRAAALVATSQGIANDIRSFSIRLDTFFSPSSFIPFQGRTRITEDGETRSYKSSFSRDNVVSVDAKKSKKDSSYSYTLPKRSHDLLSWMLHMRAKTTTWEEGARSTYYIWDGWKLAKLEATITGQRVLVTPAGKYNTWAVDIQRTRLGFDNVEKKFVNRTEARPVGTLWFTTSGDHVLVGMDFDSKLGVANIRLIDAERSPCP